ncbi:MAG: hypothetical protein Q8936_02430 [Bacillota bacterium]|nr:hypothetical protein [Bacillota bacterium]
MRIYIKQGGHRGYHIPVPLSIASSCIRLADFILTKSKNHIPKEQLEYIDCIDFKMLAVSLKHLKGYKGLKLVDVKSAAGDEVRIIL